MILRNGADLAWLRRHRSDGLKLDSEFTTNIRQSFNIIEVISKLEMNHREAPALFQTLFNGRPLLAGN